MYRSFLSWRYLWARRTNWIGIIGILVGVGAMILILSIMSGFLGETRDAVRGSLADIVIEPVLVRADGTRITEDPAQALEVVRSDPRVAAACAQLSWYGMIQLDGADSDMYRRIVSNPEFGKRSIVQLVGIDERDYLATTKLGEALRRAPLKEHTDERVADPEKPFDDPPGYRPSGRRLTPVLIGEQLAASWGLSRGFEFTIVTTPLPSTTPQASSSIEMNNRRFVVAGTFRSQENDLDLGTIFFPREALESFLGHGASYSQILVRLKDYERDGESVRDALHRELSARGLIRGETRFGEVSTWEDFKRTLLGAIENERVLMGIMLSLVMLVAGFTIFAILSMMVTEKRRDIGILSALGATPGGVTVLFAMIAFWDALLGAVGGAILGVLLATYIDPIERWLSRTLGIEIFNRNVYLFDHIPATVHPFAVALIVLFAFLCALAFAFVPAWRAGRMHPLDALRYE